MIDRIVVVAASLGGLLLAAQPSAGQSWSADGRNFTPAGAASRPLPDTFLARGGRRCGTVDREIRAALYPTPILPTAVGPASCSSSATDPDASYSPGGVVEIPVVVHIIMDTACAQGAITDEMVKSQIAILNEDFLAIAGTNGGPGNFTGIRFRLATTEPLGNPTTGITRTCNTTWFNDGGTYWDSLAWNPNHYLNIYTNTASGALGYVPFLPADGGGSLVGANEDRVVVVWDAFGRNAPIGSPFDLGRTATHEVGHWLGLEHTFSPGNGSCPAATAPGCYTSGDLICDTNPESADASDCPPGAQSCSLPRPDDNYMNYSFDVCMDRFTVEQLRRMRCSLQHYRPDVFRDVLFADGFESDSTSGWSGTSP